MDAYIGFIMPFAGNFAPRSWQNCAGQLLPITQNQALFAILGTTYGGDGRTTFGLPDLRGRAAVGVGQAPGLSNYVLGQKSGVENTTLTLAELPPHNHPIALFVNSDGSASPDPTNGYLATYTSNDCATTGTTPMAPQPNAAANVGGSQPFSNLRPYLAMMQIICVQGLFPSRN